MRRADREITDLTELTEIMDKCKVCRIAMQDEKGLYIVPLNFGYEYRDGRLLLYFHCAKEGRKLDAIAANSAVCFEMDCEHRLNEAEIPCGYSFAFQSIIGNGYASIMEDTEKKKRALTVLMKHQSGKVFTFTDAMTNAVTVFQIEASSITGKFHK